jgi:predicted DNA-binding protein with PD1-like motif
MARAGLVAAGAACAALAACAAAPTAAEAPPLAMHALRLKPGEDLLLAIQRFVDEQGIEAGWVAACAGSLTDWTLRFADRPDGASSTGRFEIVALSGTVSKHGSHLHLAVSDRDGRTTGGHLLPGCRVYTTAEIVLGEARDLVFTRAVDGTTPWRELQIARRRAR